MTAFVALTERILSTTLRDDLPLAILAPVGYLLLFDFVFRNIIDVGPMTYAQYVLPAIVIQTMFLGAMTTVDRAARDRRSEFGVRLQTLPVPAVVPLMARMTYCVLRGIVSLAASIAVGYVLGFRIRGGFAYAVAFILFVLLMTLAISLAADAAGSRAAKTGIAQGGTSSQLYMVPQMLLVMLSTGTAPIESFPDWLHPFVRNQPVSQVTETLRGFSGGHVVVNNLTTSLTWCLVLLVIFGPIALRMQRGTQQL